MTKKKNKKTLTKQDILDFILANPEAHKGVWDDGSLRCPLLSEKIITRDSFGDESHHDRISDIQSCLIIATYSNNVGDLKQLVSHENATVSKLAKIRLEKLKS